MNGSSIRSSLEVGKGGCRRKRFNAILGLDADSPATSNFADNGDWGFEFAEAYVGLVHFGESEQKSIIFSAR